jgi:hypothetical protein
MDNAITSHLLRNIIVFAKTMLLEKIARSRIHRIYRFLEQRRPNCRSHTFQL